MEPFNTRSTPLQATCTHSVHQAVLSGVFRLTENPGKAKVTEFDDLVFGDEDVFRLDVAVNALQGHKQSNQITENSRMCSDDCRKPRIKCETVKAERRCFLAFVPPC